MDKNADKTKRQQHIQKTQTTVIRANILNKLTSVTAQFCAILRLVTDRINDSGDATASMITGQLMDWTTRRLVR